MKERRSYGIVTKKVNKASATFVGNKKPSKKTIEALYKMIDLAHKLPTKK